MEIAEQIKNYRKKLNYSQEALAENIKVSRQTISNWENGKSYPDLQSLVMLSTLFEVSIDQMVKGDLQTMREEINKVDISKLNKYSVVLAFLMIVFVGAVVPLSRVLGIYALMPLGVLFLITMAIALKIEKLKKQNDVQTYKEIIAFCEGRHLNEVELIQEKAKRPYQNVLKVLISAAITVVILICIEWVWGTLT